MRHLEKSFSYKIAHDHLIIAENTIKNLELVGHSKFSTMMMKSLHSDQIQSQIALDSIKTAFDEVKAK